MTDPSVELSVVLPMYDEEQAADLALDAVVEQVAATGLTFEIVCVDDGSRDGTLRKLERRAAADPRVVVVSLSRNFGKEAAMASGLDAAHGDAVLLMDADLQHPPELIPRMVELWRSGHDVVSAVKERRARESLLYRALAAVFNRLMGGAANADFRGASDFKLLDRQVVEALRACPERSRFFRGLVAWVGFRTAEVPFRVADRVAGTSKWSVFGLVRYSARNLLAFSALPLRGVAVLGLAMLVAGCALGAQTLYLYASGRAVTGFTTVILLQLILGGLVLASIGVIAVYLSEVYDEVKRRPVFVVRRPRQGRRVEE
ncbi:MAG: glycosyltransferase family 2 protein [Polyangiaceae bacterium]|nr:glycosyltransferase family 2 protein [Polyangiaceae bacterium]